MKLNQAASAGGRRSFWRIIAVTPGKKSNAARNKQPLHDAHTGEERATTKRRKDIQGSSNYNRFLTPSWFGCRHEHIWKRCYIITLILMLWWAKTKTKKKNGGDGVWHIVHWRVAAPTACYYTAALKWAWITINCSAMSGVWIRDAHAEPQNPVEVTIVLLRKQRIEILKVISGFPSLVQTKIHTGILIYCTHLAFTNVPESKAFCSLILS